jgi:class 3 adenylate cyclase
VRGSTVHEAARIMSAAGPGEIYVSEITRALATGLRFEARGEFALKGFPAPVPLYAFAP